MKKTQFYSVLIVFLVLTSKSFGQTTQVNFIPVECSFDLKTCNSIFDNFKFKPEKTNWTFKWEALAVGQTSTSEMLKRIDLIETNWTIYYRKTDPVILALDNWDQTFQTQKMARYSLLYKW